MAHYNTGTNMPHCRSPLPSLLSHFMVQSRWHITILAQICPIWMQSSPSSEYCFQCFAKDSPTPRSPLATYFSHFMGTVWMAHYSTATTMFHLNTHLVLNTVIAFAKGLFHFRQGTVPPQNVPSLPLVFFTLDGYSLDGTLHFDT